MVRKLLLTLLLCLGGLLVMAQPQELVSASGASFNNSEGYLTFTIGDPVTSTWTASGIILTQGFLQTRLRTGTPVVEEPETRLSVFPNPVKDQLILQIDTYQGAYYMLYDMLGEMVAGGRVLGEWTQIDVSSLAPSVYILRVTDNSEDVRLFQILKH